MITIIAKMDGGKEVVLNEHEYVRRPLPGDVYIENGQRVVCGQENEVES